MPAWVVFLICVGAVIGSVWLLLFITFAVALEVVGKLQWT